MLWTPPLHVGLFWKLQDLSATRPKGPLRVPRAVPKRISLGRDPFLDHRYPLPNFLRWLLTVFISFSAVTFFFFFFSIKHKLSEFLKTGRKLFQVFYPL